MDGKAKSQQNKTIFTAAKADAITGGKVTVSNEEEGIHIGVGYNVNKLWTSVEDQEVNNIAIKAPDDKHLHFKIQEPMSTGATGELQCQKGASVSGGNPITPTNRNWNEKAPASGATVAEGVTIDTAGEDFYVPDPVLFGSDTDKKQGPAGVKILDVDLIIPPGVQAVFTVKNTAGAAIDYMGLYLLWYEADEGYSGIDSKFDY